MSYKIQIEIPFRAGHRLIEPYAGKCNNVHGEGYTAIIELQSEKLDQNGMVLDFGEIKGKIREWIMEHWDHTYICHHQDKIGTILDKELMRVFRMQSNPTAENMAQFLYEWISDNLIVDVSKVGIVESFRDSIAWYQK
jgi:6-pyruvoyltetrahydropterin/6-carboxytetrahydropterin synthase